VTERPGSPCGLCGSSEAQLCATIASRPAGEVDYHIPPDRYYRRIFRCHRCGVFFNDHSCLPASFYEGAYNEASYGSRFLARYEAVMALPAERSDNKQRAARLHAFLQSRGRIPERTRVLDIGAGLCVFPAEMLRHGYRAYAIDPDPRVVRHALEVVKVEHAWAGSVENLPANETFDLVTLNKVLEHVRRPLDGLKSARSAVSRPEGAVYVELPDGEAAAAAEGFVDRSEFYVEHLTAYGPQSIRWLVEHAGLRIVELSRLREPSGKYTIFAIAERVADAS
jgi:SAM-dependent methyltransferase